MTLPVFRRLCGQDVEALLRLQESCYPQSLWSDRPSIEGSLGWELALGAFCPGLCGAVTGYVDGREFHIFSVEVAPSARGHGIGRRLLVLAEEQARASGCDGMRAYAVTPEGARLCAAAGLSSTGEVVDIDGHIARVMAKIFG